MVSKYKHNDLQSYLKCYLENLDKFVLSFIFMFVTDVSINDT